MKKKHPIMYLLEIPMQIVLYVIAIELGAYADALFFGKLQAQFLESDYPFFTMIVFVLATIGLFAAMVASIVNFIRALIIRQKKKKAARESLKESRNLE